MQPDEFLDTLWREGATAIMRASTREAARNGMDAAIRGGFRVVEFTMTTPDAVGLIRETADGGGVVVGAGTVLSPDDARAAVDAGARFLVSPVCDPAVIAAAGELGVAVIPGCHTPTEMYTAHRAGAQLVKLFPAAGTGADAVRSILGPLPFLRIVPTNGVDEDNVVDYLRAGAFAVGFVRALFDPEDMAEKRWDWIEARARSMRSIIASVGREGRPPAAQAW